VSLPEGNVTPIFCDYHIKTTRLGYNAELTQLAASCGYKLFAKYIVPNGTIRPKATTITGLKVEVIAGMRTLLLHGNQVHAFSSEEVLNDFVSWVSDLPKSNVLVAHNGDKFDYPYYTPIYKTQVF